MDLLHQFIGTKLLRAEHTGERERLRTLRDLDASALRLGEIGLIILDPLRVEDLALSICAVLVAEACNIGLEPLVRQEIPALTTARLAWVQQNYIRAETLIRANVRLVKAQAHIPPTKAWGGGEVASADGPRFVVPVRTLHAGYNSK